MNGQSLLDVAGPIIEMTRPMGETVDGVELVLLPGEGAAAFYGVTDPDDQAGGPMPGSPPTRGRASTRSSTSARGRALGHPAVPHRLPVDDPDP